ncbi:MAG: hypothetical protein AB7I27_13595 [Bacteriovoracaceae bacterium]
MNAGTKILIITSFLTLMSCGDNHKKSHLKAPQVESDAIISNINWKIQFPGKHLPDNLLLEINGNTLLDECSGGKSKSMVKVDRFSNPMEMKIDNYFMPKRGDLKIEVKDLGIDCSSETSFIKNDDVQFSILKDLNSSELLIEL